MKPGKKHEKRRRKEMLKMARNIASRYGFGVRIRWDIQTVAVKGDGRAYEPIAELTGSYQCQNLTRVSTELTNYLPLSRIVLVLGR